MKTVCRFLAVAVVTAAAAAPSLAALEKYKDWDKGPELQYFGTDDEKAAFRKLTTDEEAGRFIALFWARRDPDLRTPRNEFKERIEALVKLADEHFGHRGRRGALTERGKVLIVLGPPKQVVPRDITPAGGPSDKSGTEIAAARARVMEYTFVYEDDRIPPFADQKKLEIVVEVDEGRGSETLRRAGPFAALQKKAVQAALVNPALKEPPVFKTPEQLEAEQKSAAEAAKGPALTPAVRAALEEALAKPPFGPLTVMPIAFRNGAVRLMAQVVVPAASVADPETTRLALLVKDRDGRDAARNEEAAGLERSKNALFAGRTVAVDPGEYEVAAALVDASGALLASGHRTAAVTAVPTEFAASPLFVGSSDLPADPGRPDETFTFSGRRFVAAAGGTFDAKDGLSYAIRIYNPFVDPVTHTVFLGRSVRIKPKSGSTVEVPAGADKPAPVPEMKDAGTLVIDLAGVIVEDNLGDYFRPGDYELRVVVTDQNSGKKVEASAPFTMAAKPAAPDPAATKK
jgi:GWxTD domain-containing protein